jgi:hypothetical protein
MGMIWIFRRKRPEEGTKMSIQQKSLVVLGLLIMGFSGGYAQRATGNFLIGQEDTSNHFLQTSPLLFPNSSKNFLVVWDDCREGPLAHYAQQFDSLGNPIGKNFPIYSNLDVAFSPNSSFLVLGEETIYRSFPYDDGVYYLKGRTCRTDGNWSELITLGSGIIPWCGTGYLGMHHDLTSFSSGYLIAFNANGSLFLSKRDWNGDTLWNWPRGYLDPYSLPAQPATISMCLNSREDFAVVWYNSTFIDSLDGIMGTFFDKTGQVIAENVLLKPREFLGATWWENWRLKILTVGDSLYQVFAFNSSSLKLSYWKMDRYGNPVGPTNDLAVYPYTMDPTNLYGSLGNFSFTPRINGKLSLLVSFGVSRSNSTAAYNSLFTFNEDGDLIGDISIDSTHSFQIGNHFFRMPDSTILLPTAVDGDIYLNAYRGFSPLWSKKVNDDSPGSNDLVSRAVTFDQNTFFVTWKNEKNSVGRKIEKDGNPTGGATVVRSDNVQFFPDGSSLELWTKQISDSMYAFGYDVHDASSSPKMIDTLAYSADPYYLFGATQIFQDSSFVVLYRKGSSLQLRQVTTDGRFTEVFIPTAVSPVSLQIIEESDTLFWIGYSGWIRLASTSLTYIGKESFLPFTAYLGGRRFLIVSMQYYKSYYGTTVTLSGDTLARGFLIDDNIDALVCKSLSKEYFAVAYRKQNQIFVRAFDINGIPSSEPLLASSSPNSAKLNPVMYQNGNKLLVAWSEARTPGNGYDVYGNIFDVDKITTVQNERVEPASDFVLYQNYPNPFNPTTTIPYVVPRRSLVTLIIYNVLGERIATLVDETKTPGTYEVRFDGSKFASGVYFCKMAAGDYTAVTKLMMVK